MTEPLRFAFGLHLHQPVGNFDSVFERHLTEVYRPLLAALVEGNGLPVTLHLSGPLLDWLEDHGADWLDAVGSLAAEGKVELLASGYDEPILAMLPRADRLEQVGRMRETLRRRFGVNAKGLWLTERVWEPDLAGDLAEAGIEYAIVDDRHFLVAGIERTALHRPWRTEADGRALSLFAIDERLRYLVPFRPPSELAEYFRALRAAGQPLAILADDGEKFGGWPGTREWVYENGWMSGFLATLRDLSEGGELRLVTFGQALREVPATGPAYLPSASYREMEGWALPPVPAGALGALERELGDDRLSGVEGALVRGTHWRSFLMKYPEANRLHKKMLAVSRLSRERGAPPEVRRAIGRAQCNDAYWHGVFGGLYLPFLRGALWRELATAEGLLRQGEPLQVERLDLDLDGAEEIWVHDGDRSLVVSPGRGGVIEEYLSFADGVNYAAVLTRRREAYHVAAVAASGEAAPPQTHGDDEGAPSIHDIESQVRLDALPPVDDAGRALAVDRVVAGGATVGDFVAAEVAVLRAWTGAGGEPQVAVRAEPGQVEVVMAWPDLTKRITIETGGGLRVEWTWDPAAWPADRWFTSEWSLFAALALESDAVEEWRYPVETVAKSERGLDLTVQGEATVLVWPVGAGRGIVRLRVP